MDSELYGCKTCAKTFETQGKLNRHLKVHSKPHRCKQCERGFALRADLDRHIRARHRLGTDKHTCPVITCQFTATRKDNIKQHLKKIHNRKGHPSEIVPTTQDAVQEHLGKNSTSRRSSPHPLTSISNDDERSQTYVGLYEALALGNVSLVQIFLEAGLDIDHLTHDGATLLHCAARAGQTSMVQFLLAKGASVRTVRAEVNLGPPICQAILSGNAETVECLLNAGHQNTYVTDLAKFLAQCDSQRILHICLSYIDQSNHANFSYKLLDAAAEKGQVFVVRTLLASHDAFVTYNAIGSSSISASMETLPMKLEVPWGNPGNHKNVSTPMHHAAAKGHLEVVQLLSQHSLEFYRVGYLGLTPLHMAARKGHASVVKFFLNLDNIDVNHPDMDHRTPLHMAVQRGRTEVVLALLDHPQVKTDCRDSYGATPLNYSALWEQWSIADILLEHGKNNPRPRASEQQCRIVPCAMMKRLLKHPHFLAANVNVIKGKSYVDREGLLHLAIRMGDVDILQLLCDHPGLDINSKHVPYGAPALGLAAELGQIEAVKILLQHKDIDLESSPWSGKTALQRARIHDHDSIVDLLLAHGAQDPDAPNDLQ